MEGFFQNLIGWLLAHGIKIVVILFAAYLINRIGKKVIERTIKRAVKLKDAVAEEKRENTLIRIFSGALNVIVWLTAVMMILPEFGVDVGPLLAGAGILGVALGFGAQYMVRDFLAGFFIILENQYRVGDVVCFNGTCGSVEDVTLRKTVLRDFDGIQHHIPNGEIKKASNLTKGFSRINLAVGVAYKENLEKVIDVLNKTGEDLARDPRWKTSIIKPPEVLGVDDFADSAIIIRILGETKPAKQWDATRELRKRIKIAFDKEGIEIPFPQISVWQRGK